MNKLRGTQQPLDIQDFLSTKVGRLEKDIQRFKKSYARMWWETENMFPSLKRQYSRKEKKKIENNVSALIDELLAKINGIPKDRSRQEEWIESLIGELKAYGKEILNISDVYIDSVFKEGFIRSTREFVECVKTFDSGLGIENLYQALRNVWIMNALQIYLNREMKHSDAIFAYSLIYPYTDNVLDDARTSLASKLHMTLKLKDWLEGKDTAPENHREEKIFKLIKKIETQYDRTQYPGVYQSLLSIYNGQIKSLVQQKKQSLPYETDVLDISLEKGGASVLADGFLVNGDLDGEQADFCFGFGLFLQLADDIQDIGEDKKNNHMTVFSQCAGFQKLDKLANKLFHFIPKILDAKLKETTPEREKLKTLILDNCHFLIMEAVGRNKTDFSRSYVEQIESHFPVRFVYLKTIRKKVKEKFLDREKTVLDLDLISAVLLTVASRTVL